MPLACFWLAAQSGHVCSELTHNIMTSHIYIACYDSASLYNELNAGYWLEPIVATFLIVELCDH